MICVFVHVSDGCPKKVWMGVGGCGELYPSSFWVFGIVLTLQRPLLSDSFRVGAGMVPFRYLVFLFIAATGD